MFVEVRVAEERNDEVKLLTLPPDMPFDKPQLEELEDNTIKLTWSPAETSPGSKSTPITYVPSKHDQAL